MILEDQHNQQLAESELNCYQLGSLQINKSKSIDFLKSDIKDQYLELNDFETMQARFKYFNILASTPEDYREYFIENNGIYCLVGIRHFGGNKDLPFIELKTTKVFESKFDILSFYNDIKHLFYVFKPKFIKIRNSHNLIADWIGSVDMVSNTKEITSRSKWKHEDDLMFSKPKDDFYNWYKSLYKDFHNLDHFLKDKVLLNSIEVMEDSNKQNLLRVINFRNMPIGLIAAENSIFLGHNALYFNEIVIDQKYKGMGLAKAVQRKFIINHGFDSQFVWGTIDANNIKSLKTAKSNGRKAISFECFINL